jgi:hypothetical protein
VDAVEIIIAKGDQLLLLPKQLRGSSMAQQLQQLRLLLREQIAVQLDSMLKKEKHKHCVEMPSEKH